MEEWTTLFPERLRQLRKSRKWLQKDLADRVGVNPSTVARWETGQHEPDLTTMQKLALIFDTNTDYLIGISDDFLTSSTQTPDLEELFKKPLLHKGKEIPAKDLDHLLDLANLILKHLEEKKD
jgi:transcriptional regulator with XRE-family HTH domain